MNSDMQSDLALMYSRMKEMYVLRCVSATLSWDQQVCLPPEGNHDRGEQLSLMATLLHQRMTDPEFVRAVTALAGTTPRDNSPDYINVRETQKDIGHQLKLPSEFVARRSSLNSETNALWKLARKENNFGLVRKNLEKVVQTVIEEAHLRGFNDHPYDALLDKYEETATLAQIKPLLLNVSAALLPRIPKLCEGNTLRATSPAGYAVEKQQELSMRVARDIGFPFSAGRLDTSAHPFSTSLGSRDARITTRYESHEYLDSLSSVIHEVGHALYDMGTPREYVGTPRGSAVSLGVHESQSRFWENIIGRSRPFTRYLHGVLQEMWPSEAERTSPEELWHRSNCVKPSLIRVDADEVTYSLHVLIRLLMEEELISQTLKVTDAPERWNELYSQYLGISSPTDADGILQDTHWYAGSFGYFPTYVLGNLYGAQLLKSLERELPTMWQEVEAGNFRSILGWMTKHIHYFGRTYTGFDLIEKVTGEKLSEAAFINYIDDKFFPSA